MYCNRKSMVRVRELLSFETSKETFSQFDLQKNFVKHIENLPQHLSEKFISNYLSITDIASRNWDLSIIGIAQSFLKIIVYRYRFSSDRFIVPMTGYNHHLGEKIKILVYSTDF